MFKVLFGILLLGFSAAQANSTACSQNNAASCALELFGPEPAISSPLICGETETLTYTLKNNTASTLGYTKFINGVASNSTVAITNQGSCGTTLAPHSSCTIKVLITAAACVGNTFPETINKNLVVDPSQNQGDLIKPIQLKVTSIPCAAVGQFDTQNNSFAYIPLSYSSLNSGDVWTPSSPQPPPPPAGAQEVDVLTSVSCNNKGTCASFGYYLNNNTYYYPFAYTSTNFGATWTAATITNYTANQHVMNGVSCDGTSTQSVCAGVGSYLSSGIYIPLTYTSNNFGVSWSASSNQPQAPSGSIENSLNAVACDNIMNTGYCTTVGGYRNSSGTIFPLAYTSNLSGNQWTISAISFIPSSGYFHGVSCDHNKRCSAVGTYVNSYGQSVPLSYISNDYGVTWNVSNQLPLLPITTPIGTANTLTSVSCDETTSYCAAVGYYEKASNVKVPLAYRSLDFGNTWQIATTLPSEVVGSNDTQLSGVSCDSTKHCAAVGYYVNGSGTIVPISYTSRDFGDNWALSSQQPAPQSAYDNGLFSVSCALVE